MEKITRNRFTFSRQLSDIIDICPADERGSLALAIITYGLDKTMPDFSGKAFELFLEAKQELDRGWQLYRNGCSKPETHKNGGAPVGNKNAVRKPKLEQYQTKADNTKQHQGKSGVTPLLYNKDNIDISMGDGELDFVEEGFKYCFFRWLDYKSERKEQYKTQSSVKAAYSKLARLSGGNPEKAAAIVEQSIAASWKGLYELNDGKRRNPSGMRTGVLLQENSTSKYDNQQIW